MCLSPQDELLAELDELQQEEVERSLLEIGGSDSLPNVPSTSLPSRPGKSLTQQSVPFLFGNGIVKKFGVFFHDLLWPVQGIMGHGQGYNLVYIPS